MIAVIFEVWPAEGRRQDYFDLAAALRDDLATIDGFLSVERFQSLGETGKLLSLSFWRDEAAVQAWRGRPSHRTTQARGRAGLFRDYRLRIADVSRDYGLHDRDQAPADSQAAHPVQVRLLRPAIYRRVMRAVIGMVSGVRRRSAWLDFERMPDWQRRDLGFRDGRDTASREGMPETRRLPR